MTEDEELIDALFYVLEEGDILSFRDGNRKDAPWVEYKVVDMFPDLMLLKDKEGEIHIMSYKDFVKMRGLDEDLQPRFTKYYDTEDYKRRSAEVDAMLKEMEEECERNPEGFHKKYGVEDKNDDICD